jgi:uncharacterized protein (DUF2062 family)
VESVLKLDLPVILVDDGSEDGSAAAVRDLDIEILPQGCNIGKGAAIKRGARRVLELGGTHMIIFDADGKYDPAGIPLFTEALRRSPHAIIYGIRAYAGNSKPPFSRIRRRLPSLLVRVISGLRVKDSQCGFRAYPVRLILSLKLIRKRFDFDLEVLVNGIWAGLKPYGVPVTATHPSPGRKPSASRRLFDSFSFIRTYFTLFLRGLMPLPHKILHGESRIPSRKDFMRPRRLIRGLVDEHGSPAGLSASTALGLFICALPLWGVHTILVVYLATVFRLNRLLAFSVSHVGTPPFLPALCLEIGYFVRHGEWLKDFNAGAIFDQLGALLVDYILGTIIVAPLLSLGGGFLTYLTALFLSRRRNTIR